MKKILFLLVIIFFIQPTEIPAQEKTTLILEIAGDISETEKYLQTYHPFITILHTYDLVFTGIAIEGKPHHIEQITDMKQVTDMHHVQEYEALPYEKTTKNAEATDLHPENIPYTGKGVNVAVIDTGIDYTHPDLQKNYQGGYDIFAMDDDPMETLPSEGMPTEHGTHVAGIIAANGKMKGVAPDANIFAYRALGPGGFGTSVHILAALEQAIKDGADIINLSLGNSVNGPDYPTSVAVNKAVDFGIAVVIANGNSGPALWTVGAPATAEKAIAVGASQGETSKAFLHHRMERKSIPLQSVHGLPSWQVKETLEITTAEDEKLTNKIVLIDGESDLLSELVREAEEKGAAGILIIAAKTAPTSQMVMNNESETPQIPVAVIRRADGEWLRANSGIYMESRYETIAGQTADFSSRGPVTVNWQIKPDLIAPGTDIYSTVPGGYQAFSGTSMAAPYVSGVLALLKEAHPDWQPEKMFQALKTTASPFLQTKSLPTTEGNGLIQPELALNPATIITDSSLHFGKMTNEANQRERIIQIENNTTEQQTYAFHIPKQTEKYRLTVPMSFTIEPNETKEVAISLKALKGLREGLHEGYVQLTEKTSGNDYYLPYLFVHQTVNQPKQFGFELEMSPLKSDYYQYQIYATENLSLFTVNLYDPDTLGWRGELFRITNAKPGVNEGEIRKENSVPGLYTAQVTAITESGEVETMEMALYLQ